MFISLLYASIPYLAVGMGLFVFHNAWVAILTYHVGIASVIFWSKRVVPFKQIVQNVTCKPLIFSVAIGASSGILLYTLWPLLSIPSDITTYMRSIGLTATAWPYFMVYYVLVNPVIEEYYWRGYLGSSVKHPTLNDFLFAGYHIIVLAGHVGVFWLIVVFLVLYGAAWYWRQTRQLTGGLLAPILSHMAADITVILALYYLTAPA